MSKSEAQKLADALVRLANLEANELADCMNEAAALLIRQDELLEQALEAWAYWLEHGETPGAHDMIQRTHAVLQERLK